MTRLLAVFIAAAVIVATNANESCGPGFRPREESEGGGCILCTEKDRAATNKDGTPKYPECAECAPGFTLEDRSEGASPSDSESGCRPCTEKDREATLKDGTTPKYPECDDLSLSPPECGPGFRPRKESEGGGCILCTEKDRAATNNDGTPKYPEGEGQCAVCIPGFTLEDRSEGASPSDSDSGCRPCTEKDREATMKDGTTPKYPECQEVSCTDLEKKECKTTTHCIYEKKACSERCSPSLGKTKCRAQKGCVFDKGQKTCGVDRCAGHKKGKCKKVGCKWSKKKNICKMRRK